MEGKYFTLIMMLFLPSLFNLVDGQVIIKDEISISRPEFFEDIALSGDSLQSIKSEAGLSKTWGQQPPYIYMPCDGRLIVTIVGGDAAARLDLYLWQPEKILIAQNANSHHGLQWTSSGYTKSTRILFDMYWWYHGSSWWCYGYRVEKVSNLEYLLWFEDLYVSPLFEDLIVKVEIDTTVSLDHFDVTLKPDTIKYAEKTTIKIQGKDKDNNNVDMGISDIVNVRMDSTGSNYGTLLGIFSMPCPGNILNINYKYARDNGAGYVADKEQFEKDEKVKIVVEVPGEPEIRGEAMLYLDAENTIEFLDASENPTDNLQISLWDGAYPGGTFMSNFIDNDSRCFYIRVHDDERNLDPGQKETITVEIGTDFGILWDPPSFDNLQEITLEETGANTGIFKSEAQLITSPDLDEVAPNQTDDGYKHGSMYSAEAVPDEDFNDRTHQCYPGGEVIVNYQPAGGADVLRQTVSVMQPKKLYLRCYVLQEAFKDIGYIAATGERIGKDNDEFDWEGKERGEPFSPGVPSEPFLDASSGDWFEFKSGNELSTLSDGRGPAFKDRYIDASIKRAKIAWAQAGIYILKTDVIKGAVFDHENLIPLFEDGRADFPPLNQLNRDGKDFEALRKVFENKLEFDLNPDILHVVFLGTEFKDINDDSPGRSATLGLCGFPSLTSRHPFWRWDDCFAFIEPNS
ncbi:MAG: hypothetical protein U5R06_05675 [candidate division KSB1 bacterium]|nr:hypothetical protein [candidate division KSB1 bacterium]